MRGNLEKQLEAVAKSDDAESASIELTNEWDAAGVALAGVEPVLRTFEKFPKVDWGGPGALTHWVEQFNGPAYVELVLASVKRKPVLQTLMLLHRLINGTKKKAERAVLISAMRAAVKHPKASADAKREAAEYVAQHD